MGAEDEMTSAPDEEVADAVGSVVIQCEGEGLTVDDDEEEGCAKEEAESVMGEEEEEEEEDEEEDGLADCESKLTLVGTESDQEVAVTLSSSSPPLPPSIHRSDSGFPSLVLFLLRLSISLSPFLPSFLSLSISLPPFLPPLSVLLSLSVSLYVSYTHI